MRNKPGKPGPLKKPGERYPSGDLKPTVAPALWGRTRRGGDPQLNSELARLCFNRELTETQAEAGFLIADVCRCSDLEELAKECTDAVSAATRGDPHATQKDRKAIDALLSEYPPKVREAVIELCVFNRAVDWKRCIFAELIPRASGMTSQAPMHYQSVSSLRLNRIHTALPISGLRRSRKIERALCILSKRTQKCA